MCTQVSNARKNTWQHYPPGSEYCGWSGHYLSFLTPEEVDYDDPCQDPCFDGHNKTTLDTVVTCANGFTFQRDQIIKCFCFSQIGRIRSSRSTKAYEQVKAEKILELCKVPAYEFFLSQVLSLPFPCIHLGLSHPLYMPIQPRF